MAEPATDWPAVLTPPILARYLGVRSGSTLMRRVRALKLYGLKDKDVELGGWLRSEIDEALARKRGIVSPEDELMRELREWEPS